ncbi:DUF5682 family protein [Delftia acidovorans]|uniref:DUF5682 family protein n=1 Tax=Delftia acidovorans TaxID=80866 RepID=UPI003015D4CB
MATSANPLHFFGIRHHGPGCARSLLQALEQLQPDCLLVEGPPEGESLLPMLQHADLQPPVAMLVYVQDSPAHAAFYPYAEFSPEWQALQWAARQGVATRFIDLPQTHRMALDMAEQERRKAEAAVSDAGDEGTYADADTAAADGSQLQSNAAEALDRDDTTQSVPAAGLAVDPSAPSPQDWRDPLDLLAEAAGYPDGESWWNRMVEERGDGATLFEGIAEAMTVVRAELPNEVRGARHAQREALREAWMRQCMREAVKAGHQRIAVVCGAWHVPALQAQVTAKADAATLKGLPKAKVQATWAPWTYRNLCASSGYGAGVDSPGWYEHLWRCSAPAPEALPESLPQAAPAAGPARGSTLRTVGWLARVAHLLRARDLDCSSAHIIEATRLAESLAALRGHASPGLPELDEAIVTVISMGERTPLRLIERELSVGDRIGGVPADVPQVPLQRDIEQQQKSLRLKPEAAAKVLALDLRKDSDRERSHFLHRLRLLGIEWGSVTTDQQRNRGTFRESWQLQWEPELAVRIIEASRYGGTLVQAAAAKVRQALTPETPLPELAKTIDDALLADLPHLVDALMHDLADRSASTGDVSQLMQALPPLANVLRYGSVRQTDTQALATVIDSMALRAAIGLPLACMALDEDAARHMQATVLQAHEALRLRDAEAPREAWFGALRSIAMGDAGAALLRGAACRLLLDAHRLDSEAVATQLGRNLSLGVPPLDAAAWLDGFLNRQALVLLHDDAIWGAVDAWLAQLGETQFTQILPLVRRSFSAFSNHDRQSLGEKARRGQGSAAVAAASAGAAGAAGDGDDGAWNEARAVLAIPVLDQLLGLNLPAQPLSSPQEAQP